MTVGAGVSVSDGRLTVKGSCVLTDVRDNIVVTPVGALVDEAFIGVVSDQTGSRRVFPVGKLEYVPFFFFLVINLVICDVGKGQILMQCFMSLYGFAGGCGLCVCFGSKCGG